MPLVLVGCDAQNQASSEAEAPVDLHDPSSHALQVGAPDAGDAVFGSIVDARFLNEGTGFVVLDAYPFHVKIFDVRRRTPISLELGFRPRGTWTRS
jgi:hypothetical protein